MTEYVLDASALLALLNAENGADLVQELLPESVVSAVNLAEVVIRLSTIGMPEHEIREVLSLLGLVIVPYDEKQAYQTGFIQYHGKSLGLSLGDRACLSLAKEVGATAVTADRAWIDLEIGIPIRLIR